MIWIYLGVAKYWLADAMLGIREEKKADKDIGDSDAIKVVACNGDDESEVKT